MHNLGNHPVSKALASHLMNAPNLIDQLTDGLPLELPYDMTVKVPKIANYRGDGKKRFIATLDFDEKTVNFLLHLKGFGVFSMDTNYYVFASVIGLLRYLKEQRFDNDIFLARLGRASNLCASTFLAGEVSFVNQRELALGIATVAFKS
jgi:hypothetical protein